MKHVLFTILILSSLLLGIAACTAENAEAVSAIATCEADSGQLFTSEQGDYCLVYPQDYCWLPSEDGLLNGFISVEPVDDASRRCPDEPLILHGEVVWVSVNVTPTNGQSLAEASAALTEGLEGFGLEITEQELGGETAVQINNMPGQDIRRELLTVHNDQLYQLTFVPASADYGDRYIQMQTLYDQVIETFQFLP